jgi:CHAD domain-containing protein
LYARCGRKPTKKRVHALRVVTLRILAELEFRVGEQGLNGSEEEAAARWIKLGEKLRQALSPVREADVWLAKLASLRDSLADTNGYSPRSSQACIQQIGELEERLKSKRRQWEKKLVAEIDSRSDKLDSSSRQIEDKSRQPIGVQGSAKIAEQFAHIVEEFPSLDADNLHEFRKSIKKVRYMAEIFAAQDVEAGRQATLIRKMQSAIGEWHDWQVLAKREGHGHGKREELTELLGTLAAESLEKVLAVCERATENLLKRGDRAHDTSLAPPKKPVRRAEPVAAPVVSISA